MNKGLAYPLLAIALLLVAAVVIGALSREPQLVIPPVNQAPLADENKAVIAAVAINEPIQPIPVITVDTDKAALGERLFYDPRLSHDNSISCYSCHDLGRGGTDHRQHSIGVGGAMGSVNTLTVFNAALNFRNFWNGRADDLKEQLDQVIASTTELASSWPEVIAKLKQDPDYVLQFTAAFEKSNNKNRCSGKSCADLVNRETVTAAIVEFERSLITPNSRFDRYLLGDESAITAEEKAGYALFKSYGCVACHQGRNVGGNMFQIFGVMDDYFANRGHITDADYGRFNVTGREEDRFHFRVPSLRNVALTAPYFHDGTAESLDQAVMVMARYQLGVTMPAEDVGLIVKFLGTLTGEYKGQPL